MSFIYTKLVRKICVGSSSAKAVLYMLADHANEKGYCFPSIGLLAFETEFSTRTVIKAISILEEHGLIKVSRRKNCVNQYYLSLAKLQSLSKEEVLSNTFINKPSEPNEKFSPPNASFTFGGENNALHDANFAYREVKNFPTNNQFNRQSNQKVNKDFFAKV